MSLLIATDEAGYGPRLGPLVIVATAWRLQPGFAWDGADDRLAEPIDLPGVGTLRVDDSKLLFRPAGRSAGGVGPDRGARADGLGRLRCVTVAAANWAGLPDPDLDESGWFKRIAAADWPGLLKQPWFAGMAAADRSSSVTPGVTKPDVTEANEQQSPGMSNAQETDLSPTQRLIRHWQAGGLQLVGIAARVIDAARYNRMLGRENKADLLSRLTCELALGLLHQHADGDDPSAEIDVFSDRHGGRSRYGALLQHHCPDRLMSVVVEGKPCSEYRLRPVATADQRSPSIRWRFTIKGDRFPPVAMSSIVAKATRERLMGHFNAYFRALRMIESGGRGPELRPTAGYAVDADRFLAETESLRRAHSIADERLIRSR